MKLVSLEDQQAWMRERQSQESTEPTIPNDTGLHREKHYRPKELGVLWSLSADAVRKLFENEPDVLILGEVRPGRSKRRYRTVLIPASVAARVHRRLRNR